MEDIIKVEGVAKAYGKHQVHKGLDLGIKKGECFTLLGPSGCGKTVLIRLIAGHEVPDEGRIIIDNTVVADSASGEYIPPERRGLGIVFQDYAVWPHMTVYDNIAYPLKMEKRPKEEIDKLKSIRESNTFIMTIFLAGENSVDNYTMSITSDNMMQNDYGVLYQDFIDKLIEGKEKELALSLIHI